MYYPCSENKALISFAVTVKLICVFVLAHANSWFSHAQAQMMFENTFGVFELRTFIKDINYK